VRDQATERRKLLESGQKGIVSPTQFNAIQESFKETDNLESDIAKT